MGGFSDDPLTFLVHPETKSAFLADTWEKKAAVYSPRSQLTDKLDIQQLCTILDEKEEHGQCLRFGIDCCAMAYVDGERSDLGGSMGEVLVSRHAQSLYDKGATLQVHQPQRFSDALWKLCAALEAQLGCLVGCNAYITPAGAQGLAPHWDDVSIFVIQTAGTKAWKVYGALPGCELPNASSGDIARSSLPAPVLEVTLKVGDVLFVPRGHVHEAVAQSDGAAHVTVSAYQEWTWMHMASSVLKACNGGREPCPDVPESLRAGLPTGFVFAQSLTAGDLASMEGAKGTCDQKQLQPTNHSSLQSKGAASTLASALRAMADAIEQHPAATSTAAQAMGLAFMRNRLPPHPDQLPPSGAEPTLNSLVCCRKQGNFLLTSEDAREWMYSDQDPDLASQDSSDEEEEEDEDDLMQEDEDEEDEDEDDMHDVLGGNDGSNKRKENGATAKKGSGGLAAAKSVSEGAEPGSKTQGKKKKANRDNGEGSEDEQRGKGGSKGVPSLQKGLVELDSEGGDSSGEDSDAVIDPEDLQEELEEEFVVLTTCLHNDRGTHMVDPRLVAALEQGALDGPGDAAAHIDEDGDEPPYDLVPLTMDSGKGGGAGGAAPAVKQPAAAKSQSPANSNGEDAAGQGLSMQDKEASKRMPWMLDIPSGQALAVAKLLECVNGKSMRVASLPLQDDREKMELVLMLHEWGALRTLPDQKKHAKKQHKGPKTFSQGVAKKDGGKQHGQTGSKGTKMKHKNKGRAAVQ